jgi:hypothetical protein
MEAERAEALGDALILEAQVEPGLELLEHLRIEGQLLEPLDGAAKLQEGRVSSVPQQGEADAFAAMA